MSPTSLSGIPLGLWCGGRKEEDVWRKRKKRVSHDCWAKCWQLHIYTIHMYTVLTPLDIEQSSSLMCEPLLGLNDIGIGLLGTQWYWHILGGIVVGGGDHIFFCRDTQYLGYPSASNQHHPQDNETNHYIYSSQTVSTTTWWRQHSLKCCRRTSSSLFSNIQDWTMQLHWTCGIQTCRVQMQPTLEWVLVKCVQCITASVSN